MDIKWNTTTDKFYAIKFFDEFEAHTRYNELVSYEGDRILDVIDLSFKNAGINSKIENKDCAHIRKVPVNFGSNIVYMNFYFVNNLTTGVSDIYWINFNDGTTRYPSIIVLEEAFRNILLNPTKDEENLNSTSNFINDILPDFFKYLYLSRMIDGVNAPGVSGFLNLQQYTECINPIAAFGRKDRMFSYGRFSIDRLIAHCSVYNVYNKVFPNPDEIMKELLKDEYSLAVPDEEEKYKVVDLYITLLKEIYGAIEEEDWLDKVSYLDKQIEVTKALNNIVAYTHKRNEEN